MKQYKKGLLCIMVLSAISLMAADSKSIYVNTFDDEIGENPNKCSLREAIISAQKNTSFGGCNAGRTGVGLADVIELEAGTYTLTRGELKPESAVKILGKSRKNYQTKSALTDEYPAFENIQTIIQVKEGDSRIFNTAETRVDLTLTDIALKNGYAKDYGGAVYAGGNFTLVRGAILNSKAVKAGGAIYTIALDVEKEIRINNTRIENNHAPKGSVMAMSCLGNMNDNKPVITISQSSIVHNGQADSLSVLDLCGSNTVGLEANTIAQNTARASDGSIIRAVSSELDRLSPDSVIVLKSNTIVKNNAFSTFYYDSNASKYFSYNIIAYNGTADGKGQSCRYLNNQTPDETLPFTVINNALELSENKCILPVKALEAAKDSAKNLDISGVAFSTLLTDFQQASVYNLYLPLYYPKESTSGVSLVNIGANECSKFDQRGIARNADATLMLNTSLRNSCEIGSVEMLKFNAADVDNLGNISQKEMIADIQAVIDRLKADITEPERQEYKLANEADLKEAESYLSKLKNNLIYRAVYMNPFALALPQEINVGSTEERKYKTVNAENYDVDVKTIGIGTELTVDSSGKPQIKGDLSDLVCEWNANLSKILVYRKGGNTTPDQFAYCQYTLKEKTGSKLESSGILKAKFSNIAPIALSDQYGLSTDNNLTVRVNPLENDSDDGDGPASKLPTDKKLWHKNIEGKDIPIYFENIPSGLNFTAEYSGPCPGVNEKNTCYGGTMEFAAKNNFSQFSYDIVYKVYDSEGAESGTATISLLNGAKDTNSSSSGGGSIGGFGVLALAGLAFFRMRKSYKE